MHNNELFVKKCLWAISFNWIERNASDVEVVGSSPTWPAKKNYSPILISVPFFLAPEKAR